MPQFIRICFDVNGSLQIFIGISYSIIYKIRVLFILSSGATQLNSGINVTM